MRTSFPRLHGSPFAARRLAGPFSPPETISYYFGNPILEDVGSFSFSNYDEALGLFGRVFKSLEYEMMIRGWMCVAAGEEISIHRVVDIYVDANSAPSEDNRRQEPDENTSLLSEEVGGYLGTRLQASENVTIIQEAETSTFS